MVRVLVVEDDEDIRGLVAKTMELQGYDVDTAPDGASGWARLNLERYDLVLLDWMMPALGGLDLVKACRADPDLEDLPIVMLTAKAREEDLRTGMDAGATAYVSKPFSPRALVDVVATLLR